MPRHFENWLKAYIEHTRGSEAPTLFHFWTGVSTIAGALRRHICVNELTYEITPNFYIVLVAPAGIATKSTTLNLGMDLLTNVPDVRFGPSSGSWQGVGDTMQESTIYFKKNKDDPAEKPKAMSAITCAASELGTFLRPDDGQAMSFLTDMWDGKVHTYQHRTKHSGGIEIINPWINLIGATTPSWIKSNVPETMIGDGLMSRIVFIYGDKKRHLVARPSKVYVASEFYESKSKLVEDLVEIASLVGEVQYSDKADEWMDIWYKKLYESRSPHMASERLNPYIARKQTHIIKMAMVLSVAKRSTLVLELEDFLEAEKLLSESEASMIKVFESIGIVDDAKQVAELVAFVRAFERISGDDLYYNCCHNIMQFKDFKNALTIALKGNLIRSVNVDGKLVLEPVKRTVN